MTGERALLIDFGSTYTKLRAVDLDEARVTAAGQGPSTVTTDVTIGLEAALADLLARLAPEAPDAEPAAPPERDGDRGGSRGS